MAPYFAGVSLAYMFVMTRGKPSKGINVGALIFEWLFFICLGVMHICGPTLERWSNICDGMYLDGSLNVTYSKKWMSKEWYVYYDMWRFIYAILALAVFKGLISEKKPEGLAWAQPSTYIRGFFSLGIWVPLSRLGLGAFLFHTMIAQKVQSEPRYIQGESTRLDRFLKMQPMR